VMRQLRSIWNIMGLCILYLSSWGWTGCCEWGNEPLGVIKCRNFVACWPTLKLLKMDAAWLVMLWYFTCMVFWCVSQLFLACSFIVIISCDLCTDLFRSDACNLHNIIPEISELCIA
jgi:hypothetical protein